MATTTRTSSTPRRRRSAPRPVTPISGFVCPREDLQGRVRDGTITLLDDCLDTFELYRRVAATSDDRTHRRRALGQPDELRKALALDSDEYAAYHAAILRLRAWCEQDPDSAAREMVALTIAQVEQDLRCAAAKRVLTDASRWQAVNDAKVRAVTWLYTARDELVAGLGWPHPGEEVIVQTTYTAGVGKRAQQVTYDGPAWYATSFNTMNTMHSVGVVDALDHAHVVWTPLCDGNHGPAMPDGDIPCVWLRRPTGVSLHPCRAGRRPTTSSNTTEPRASASASRSPSCDLLDAPHPHTRTAEARARSRPPRPPPRPKDERPMRTLEAVRALFQRGQVIRVVHNTKIAVEHRRLEG